MRTIAKTKVIKKLRNSIDWTPNYFGKIPAGTYEVETPIYKITEVVRTINSDYASRRLHLLPNQGTRIVLKNQYDTIAFNVIYCADLSKEDNLQLIENHCNKLSKNQQIVFWGNHAYDLKKILGKDFTKLFLRTIFKLGRIPKQFEVWKGEEKIVDPKLHKDEWENNPEDFELVSYKKLD